MSLPRTITLDLFQHHFAQINGVVTYYALERIFNSMRGARASTNEEKREWADREWKQDDCDYEDPYQYGLPCRYMLIRCLMQRLPISPALIHPRWCIAKKLIAAPDWQPRYIKDMAFQGNPLLGHLEALTRIRLSVLHLLDIIKDLPTKEMGELANKFEDFEVA
jgi:hypothetical protein